MTGVFAGATRRRGGPVLSRIAGACRRVLGSLAIVLLALGLSLGLKLHYRRAAPGELAWILAPTAALVQAATGTEFEFESGAGWISRSRAFLIAPPCAGINFLVVVLLSLSLLNLAEHSGRWSAGRMVALLLTAYAATVVTNALRITVALEAPQSLGFAWLSPEGRHRWAGVAVYLGGLWITTRLWRRVGPAPPTGAGGRGGPRQERALWMWIPPGVYLGVVSFLPWLRGLLHGLAPPFANHCLTVAAGCLFVWGGLFLLQRMLRRRAQSARSRPSFAPPEMPASAQSRGATSARHHIDCRG